MEDAAVRLALDTVLFVPNRLTPHKGGQLISDPRDRVAMVELAVADNPRFAVSLIELERPGPSYTLDTMRELSSRLGPNVELYFLVGCDALPVLHTWHQPEALLSEFHVVFMERPLGRPVNLEEVEQRFPHLRRQATIVDVALLEISGENIRHRVREGLPIRYYVLPPVRRYIEQHGLYRDSSAES